MVFMVGFGVYPTPLIAFSQDSVPGKDIFFALPTSISEHNSMSEDNNNNDNDNDNKG
jgi:hypothetical protein